MSLLKITILSIVPGLVGALGTAIVEFKMNEDITILYAAGGGLLASLISLLIIIMYLQKKKVTNVGENSEKDIAIQSNKKKDKFTDSPIFVIGLFITIIISLFTLVNYGGSKIYEDYSILDGVDSNIVTVKASGYTEWKYIIDTAINGCIRVGDMLIPISMGSKEYPGQSSRDKLTNILYIYSFKCVSIQEAKRINKAMDNRF